MSFLKPALCFLQLYLPYFKMCTSCKPYHTGQLSAVGIQPSPASFSLRVQNKGCNNIAPDTWKKGWLILQAQKINRLGTEVQLYRYSSGLNISLIFLSCTIITRHCEISLLNILFCYLYHIRLWNKISNNLACLCVQSSKQIQIQKEKEKKMPSRKV